MLKQMKSYAHIKPGRNGTKRLVEKYGDALVCVRFRYDEVSQKRFKTVELIVEQSETGRLRHHDMPRTLWSRFASKDMKRN